MQIIEPKQNSLKQKTIDTISRHPFLLCLVNFLYSPIRLLRSAFYMHFDPPCIMNKWYKNIKNTQQIYYCLLILPGPGRFSDLSSRCTLKKYFHNGSTVQQSISSYGQQFVNKPDFAQFFGKPNAVKSAIIRIQEGSLIFL